MGLGAFEVVGKLGAGGMGEVWRAVHRAQGTEVAIKLLAPHHVLEDGRLRALFSEVRAAASLNHPHVVAVFDHGQLDPTEAAALGIDIQHWTPWLSMELCEGGTLRQRRKEMDWPRLRLVLLQLLDALAHAHARGVVHRDLKPSNVLFAGNQVKLSDFGLVFAAREAVDGDEAPLYGGTPHYMAPEQVDGEWREQGPWTDLYSLGCMTWRLVTGKPPFPGRSIKVLQAHLTSSPPPFVPRIPVPDGLEHWLRRLLRKAPRDRFRFSADAAWALMRLGRITDTLVPIDDGADTLVPEMSTALEKPSTSTLILDDVPPLADEDSSPSTFTPAPMPLSWRRPMPPPPAARLHGVGLGLYGLREIPLVGRVAERDQLWAALTAVRGDLAPRAAVIRGPDGAGKSRLARWLVERADEVGAANSAEITHDERAADSDGVAGMVRRLLRCRGLERDAIAGRIRTVALDLDRAHVRTLLDWLDSPGEAGGPSEREAALELLVRAAGDRPLVLRVEDAQWGPDSVRFVAELLDRGRALPILALVTARDDVRLPALEGRPNVAWIDLSPLQRAQTRKLVRGLLGLQPQVAAMVENRCEGNPMFAVQLVGDWVARGYLTVIDDEFALRDGHVPTIPDALHDTWSSRVSRALADRTDAEREALERAAYLGRTVVYSEWEAVCAETGLRASTELVDQLAGDGLVSVEPDRWTFGHALLVESLIRLAKEGGRANGHRAAIGACRVGRARVSFAAGRFGEAAGPLRDAEAALDAQGWLLFGCVLRHTGPPAPARQALEWALIEGAPTAAVQLEQGRLAHDSGELDEAAALLQAAMVGSGDDPDLRGECLAALGALHHDRGRSDQARGYLQGALATHQATGSRRLEAAAMLQLGRIASALDGAAVGSRQLVAAGRVADRSGDAYVRAQVRSALAAVAREVDDADGASRLWSEALELWRRVGAPRGLADTVYELARLRRDQGRLGRAADLFGRAQALYAKMECRPGASAVRAGRAVLYAKTGLSDEAAKVRRELEGELGPAAAEEPRWLRVVREDLSAVP